MTTKENQRVRLTKRLFQDSILELMKNKNINKITVKELCEKADLNRTTFYLHYGIPEDVLTEIENDFIEKTKAHLININAKDRTAGIESFLIYIKENRIIISSLMGEYGRDEFRRYFFESVFPSGIFQNEEHRVNLKTDTYVDAFIISGAFSSIYTWLLNDFSVSTYELAKLIDIMITGVSEKYIDSAD
jgi:AcrR family transcriptional regulator